MSIDFSNHEMVTKENWEAFTEEDHNTWKVLFQRQTNILDNRATQEIVEGLHNLGICENKIPKFSDLNKILKEKTNFEIIPVTGLIPYDLFFEMLANRKFPSTCFIRKPHQLDYLEEPDIFHDVYGHVPLLANPIFADFMEMFGKKSMDSIELGLLANAAALYWFTVEFGLINTKNGLRIYGAGITSSKGESIYCLESDEPVRIKFNLLRLMKTLHHPDSYQKTYFVINNFEELFESVRNLDWEKIKEALINFPNIEQKILLNKEESYLV